MKKVLVISMIAVAAASQAQVWTGTGGAITDATTVAGVSNFQINAVPGLTSVSAIAIRGLTHSWSGDLRAVVTHVPSNTSVVLFSRIGRTSANGLNSPFGSSDDFAGDYIFSLAGADIAAAAAAAGTVIAPGQYFSSNGHNGTANTSTANGFFPGGYSAGTWNLEVSDWGGGDTGGFQSWEIRGQAVPEPATMAALGLGALALIRRRRSK